MWWGGMQSHFCVWPNQGYVRLSWVEWGFDNFFFYIYLVWTHRFLESTILWNPHFFCHKVFQIKKCMKPKTFFGPKFFFIPEKVFGPKFLWTQNVFGPIIFWTQNLFWPKMFWTQNFGIQNFLNKNLFWLKICMDLRFFGPILWSSLLF